MMRRVGLLFGLAGLVLALSAGPIQAGSGEEFQAGRTAFEKEEYLKAVEHFTKAIEAKGPSGKETAGFYFWRARAQEERSRFYEALEDYREALSLDMGNDDYARNVMRVRQMLKPSR